EDGIRDRTVTGVQTCALPICGRNRGAHALLRDGAKIVECADDILEELGMAVAGTSAAPAETDPVLACLPPGEPVDLDAIAEKTRSEERRVGKGRERTVAADE